MVPPANVAGMKQLSNALATPDQISRSSSSIDGVAPDLEASIRFAGAQLTQAAGVLLRLSQDIIAQAIVTFTRFWIGSEGGSLRIYSVKVCVFVFLSTKAEDKGRRSNWMELGLIGRVRCIALPDSKAVVPTDLPTLCSECLHVSTIQGCVASVVRERKLERQGHVGEAALARILLPV